ncbi:MAG: NifU family protein, partial [Victivallales bacterium]|nr:NifU family protein [Victivallales bacterium]
MKELHDKIRARLEELRVYLQNDGGDMEVVNIEDKLVTLR